MNQKYMWYFFGVVGLFLLSGLFKTKACQDSASGDLAARPWFYPCPKGSDVTLSASTE